MAVNYWTFISEQVFLCVVLAVLIFFDINLANDFTRKYTSRHPLLICAAFYLSFRLMAKAGWDLWLYPRFVDPLRHLPQAPQASFFSRFFMDPGGPEYELWINTVPNSGLIRYYGRFNVPSILVTSMHGCDEVLQSEAAHFPKQPSTRKILKMWLGTDTLLSSTDGGGHKVLRKKLLPAFYARNIKELQPVLSAKALQMCDALHGVVSYNNDRVLEVNLNDLIDRVALDAVGLAGHGVDFNTLKEPSGELGKLHKRAFDLGKKELQVILSALLLPDLIFDNLPFKVYRDNRAGVRALREHCRAAIREEIVADKTRIKSIVSMAAQQESFQEDELVELSMDLLVAGHKTVSSALQLAFSTLAQYTEVQVRLRKEIQVSTNPAPGNDIEIHLPYLDAFLNELLRLYPPLSSMSRLSTGKASICGQTVPPGTTVVVSQWAMNRCTAVWGEDAAIFIPGRWLEGTPIPNSLTFSKGPRNCIGEGFARREIATILAAVVRRFELSMVADALREKGDGEIAQGITLSIKNGCRVGVKEI